MVHLVDLELLDDSYIGQMPMYINLEDYQAKIALYIWYIKPLEEKRTEKMAINMNIISYILNQALIVIVVRHLIIDTDFSIVWF